MKLSFGSAAEMQRFPERMRAERTGIRARGFMGSSKWGGDVEIKTEQRFGFVARF